MRQSPSTLSSTTRPIPLLREPRPLGENKVFCCLYGFLSAETCTTNDKLVSEYIIPVRRAGSDQYVRLPTDESTGMVETIAVLGNRNRNLHWSSFKIHLVKYKLNLFHLLTISFKSQIYFPF